MKLSIIEINEDKRYLRTNFCQHPQAERRHLPIHTSYHCYIEHANSLLTEQQTCLDQRTEYP